MAAIDAKITGRNAARMITRRLVPLALTLASVSWAGACVSTPPLESIDLSEIGIGDSREKIEEQLKIRSQESSGAQRTIVVYEYGPDTGKVRRAAEAEVVCLSYYSIGGMLACSLQRSLHGALAESAVADLQGSLLQVIYDVDERAEWIVFGSTVRELQTANEMIERAESGDAQGAALVGKNLSLGSKGFTLDRPNAYKWLSLAVNFGVPEAARERDRLRSRLSAEEVTAIDAEVLDWAPRAGPSP